MINLISKEAVISGKRRPVTMRAYSNNLIVAQQSGIKLLMHIKGAVAHVSITMKFTIKTWVDRIEVITEKGVMKENMADGPTFMEQGGTITITQKLEIIDVEEKE